MTGATAQQTLKMAAIKRAVLRQSLVALGQANFEVSGLSTTEAVLAAVTDQLSRTAHTSKMLRATAPPPVLDEAVAALTTEASNWLFGVRWAPAAADQISYVLLRLLAGYETWCRELDERIGPAKGPMRSDRAFKVAREGEAGS